MSSISINGIEQEISGWEKIRGGYHVTITGDSLLRLFNNIKYENQIEVREDGHVLFNPSARIVNRRYWFTGNQLQIDILGKFFPSTLTKIQ